MKNVIKILIIINSSPLFFVTIQGEHNSVLYGTHYPNKIFVGCLPPKVCVIEVINFCISFIVRLFFEFRSIRWKQLESGAAKTEEILKTPQQKGFLFFISKNLILTGKKHCDESRRFRNASAGPEYTSFLIRTSFESF